MWRCKFQVGFVATSIFVIGTLSVVAQQPPPLPVPDLKTAPAPAPPTAPAQAAPGQVQTPAANPAPQPVITLTPVVSPLTVVAPQLLPTNLVADADSKSVTTKPGDLAANFTFTLTNIASTPIIIHAVSTSCGCTVAKVPPLPWTLEPGTNGPIEVSVNLAGKMLTFAKTVTVLSSAGPKYLTVNVTMPPPVITPQVVTQVMTNSAERERNMQLAKADRQAVFKGDCAKCHGDPAAQGKSGKELYVAVCGVCHDDGHRASVVPDLAHLTVKTDAQYWRTWITAGKVATMMPAFAKAEGGPLNEEQINSLVHYMGNGFITAALRTPVIRPVIVQPVVAPGLRPVPVRR